MLLVLSLPNCEAKGKLLDGMSRRSAIISGYEGIDTVTRRMASMPLHEIEGIWRLTGEGGSVIAIERHNDDESIYRMVVVASADISVQPGTVIGYLAPTARHREYDSRLFSARSDDYTMLTDPTRNLLMLDDTCNRLSFRPYGRKLRFNWWRLLLPYLYRTLVTPLESSAGASDGCVRLYPTPTPPLNPRYL